MWQRREANFPIDAAEILLSLCMVQKYHLNNENVLPSSSPSYQMPWQSFHGNEEIVFLGNQLWARYRTRGYRTLVWYLISDKCLSHTCFFLKKKLRQENIKKLATISPPFILLRFCNSIHPPLTECPASSSHDVKTIHFCRNCIIVWHHCHHCHHCLHHIGWCMEI